MIRSENQDAILVATPFFAVADGVGGHVGGAVAARVAIAALRMYIGERQRKKVDVVEAVMTAHAAVSDRAGSASGTERMGTTLTFASVLITGDALTVEIGHVGDSRAYLVSGGHVHRLTTDHSLVAELLERGAITHEEAVRHPLASRVTRVLGQAERLEVDFRSHRLRSGDVLLLATDGLTKHVSDDEILADVLTIMDAPPAPEQAVRLLVANANRHGGSDNVSVVCAQVTGDDGRHA